MVKSNWILLKDFNIGLTVRANPVYGNNISILSTADEFAVNNNNDYELGRFLSADNSIWIYNPELSKTTLNKYFNSTTRAGVSKLNQSYYHINNNAGLVNVSTKFKLRLTDFLDLEVKCPLFPDPDKWYCVVNHSRTELRYLITSMIKNVPFDISTLEFAEEFEVAALDTKSDNISKKSDLCEIIFVNPRMPEYKICKDNYTFALMNKFKKKTKSLVPGHKYSNPGDGSVFYCVAELRSRLDLSTGYVNNNLKEKNIVWVTVDEIPKGTITSFKDILVTKAFNSINSNTRFSIIYKNFSRGQSFYDLGTFTDVPSDLPPNIQTLFPELWNNIKNDVNSNVYLSSFRKEGEICSRALELLFIQSPGYDTYKDIPDSIKNEMLDYLRKLFERSVLWSTSSGLTCSNVMSLFHRMISLNRTVCSGLRSSNVLTTYHSLFLHVFNIVLDDKYFKQFESIYTNISTNFDLYCSYIDYLLDSDWDRVKKLYFSRLDIDDLYNNAQSFRSNDLSKLGYSFRSNFYSGDDKISLEDNILKKLSIGDKYFNSDKDQRDKLTDLYKNFYKFLNNIMVKEIRNYIKTSQSSFINTMTIINNIPICKIRFSLTDIINCCKKSDLTDDIKKVILDMKFGQVVGWISLTPKIEKDVFEDNFRF